MGIVAVGGHCCVLFKRTRSSGVVVFVLAFLDGSFFVVRVLFYKSSGVPCFFLFVWVSINDIKNS